MNIINICENLLLDEINISNVKQSLFNYFNNQSILHEIYFSPKKIELTLLDRKLDDNDYIDKVIKTINFYRSYDINQLIRNILSKFEVDTGYNLTNEKLYVIVGLDTTTIYSTIYQGESITVLLLESTEGYIDKLSMLLAHEYTHFIRKIILDKNIFEDSIGERFVTEGIASNYSREIAPNKEDSDYCIVPNNTVKWVVNNEHVIERLINENLKDNSLMEDFFYMYASTKVDGMPVRCGYVYGYLKVKKYLENNNLKVKDIIGIDWNKIIH